VVESLPCLWEIKKLDPLEAILAASSPICSKGLAVATSRLTVSQPMSAPGHGFWPGLWPQISIREVFLSLLPWRGKPNSRVISRHLSKGFSAFACRLTPLLDAGRSTSKKLASYPRTGRDEAAASNLDRPEATANPPCGFMTATPVMAIFCPELGRRHLVRALESRSLSADVGAISWNPFIALVIH
jgi:hypothetical protein